MTTYHNQYLIKWNFDRYLKSVFGILSLFRQTLSKLLKVFANSQQKRNKDFLIFNSLHSLCIFKITSQFLCTKFCIQYNICAKKKLTKNSKEKKKKKRRLDEINKTTMTKFQPKEPLN